jgi:predicted small lipoprotein YifL
MFSLQNGACAMKKVFVLMSIILSFMFVSASGCKKKAPTMPPEAVSAPTDMNTATVSPTATVTVTMTSTPPPDAYEPDDEPAGAKDVTVGALPQLHNFSAGNDVDFITFSAFAGTRYLVRAVNVNGSTMPFKLVDEYDMVSNNSWSDMRAWAYLPVFCGTDQVYTIRISNNSADYGYNTDYELDVIALPAITPVNFNDAADNQDLNFTFSGDSTYGAWIGQSNVYHDNGSGAESPHLDNAESAAFSTTVTADVQVRFWWKVSSESCCDNLTVWVDGDQKDIIMGQTDWAQVTVDAAGPGPHTIMWQYHKDVSFACGYDTAWVDNIEVLP